MRTLLLAALLLAALWALLAWLNSGCMFLQALSSACG